jgi:hypothetical protein
VYLAELQLLDLGAAFAAPERMELNNKAFYAALIT